MNVFKRKTLYAAVLASLALAGCAAVPDMTNSMASAAAEARTEAKSADAGCFKVTGPLNAWGIITTWINVAKNVIRAGDVAVEADCAIKFSNGAVVKP